MYENYSAKPSGGLLGPPPPSVRTVNKPMLYLGVLCGIVGVLMILISVTHGGLADLGALL
jgi:hypothetical protein